MKNAIRTTSKEGRVMEKFEFRAEPVTSSARPIVFDETLCIGCNRCVEACQCDVLFPGQIKGSRPIVMYPGECYYCGACVMSCPRDGAIKLKHPLMNRARFILVKN